jgi:hypothetical protein
MNISVTATECFEYLRGQLLTENTIIFLATIHFIVELVFTLLKHYVWTSHLFCNKLYM